MKEIEYLKKYVDKEHLEEAIGRFLDGEPLQYIVGNVNFYGYIMSVNKNVLIPRFETEELVDQTILKIRKKFRKEVQILDLCTGSGCIAITLKKETNSVVTASDISKSALKVAKENAIQNEVDITLIESDLFQNIDGKFDVIISNPPYIAYDEEIDELVKNNEPHLALYAKNNGLYFYEEILKNIEPYLNESFIIAFEIGCFQAEEIKQYVHQYLKDVTIEVGKDLQGRDRFIWIER